MTGPFAKYNDVHECCLARDELLKKERDEAVRLLDGAARSVHVLRGHDFKRLADCDDVRCVERYAFLDKQ